MTRSTYLLFTCLMAALFLPNGECKKCYVCTSATDSKCSDPMTPEEGKAVQCSSDIMKQAADAFNTVNKKLKDFSSNLGLNIQTAKPVDANLQCSKLDITEGDKKVTVRGCVVPPTENFDPCKELTDRYTSDSVKVSFCGICNTDYCNAASTLDYTAVVFLPLLAVLLASRYR